MAIAKIFMSGRSQAVRLPKAFRLSAKQVSVARVGRSRVVAPIEPHWSGFFGMLADPLDTLIAAHAISLDASLVANKVPEFSRVPVLRVEHWTTP